MGNMSTPSANNLNNRDIKISVGLHLDLGLKLPQNLLYRHILPKTTMKFYTLYKSVLSNNREYW